MSRNNRPNRKNYNRSNKRLPYNQRRPRARSAVVSYIPGPMAVRRDAAPVLRFQKSGILLNAGITFANVRFEPTYAYDVDPVSGSTAMPYFTEYAAMYRFYRVIWFRVSVTFSNLDSTTSGTAYICPSNTDPGANSSTAQNLLSNRMGKSVVFGPSTGNGTTRTLSKKITVDKFGGVRYTRTIDNYFGSVTGTAPLNNIFFALGAYTSVGMTSGVYYDCTIDICLDFVEVQTPST